MQSFHRETMVDAPLERVWAFYSTVDGLRRLTPDWMALRIESIDHPPQTPQNEAALVPGTEIRSSVAPFWVCPRQSWVSVVESRSQHDDVCSFVDSMHGGPFKTWKHTHRFVASGDQTRVIDHVDYTPPCDSLGSFLTSGGLSAVFAYRHRRTREILGEP